MRSVGIAGTAKNTGKTTSLGALIEASRARGLRLALTSIGYDGEAWDNVTRLPKPRVRVGAGTLLATAEDCLQAGTASLDVVCETGVSTPLGAVIIAQATSEGTVVLAGPNKTDELAWVQRVVAQEEVDLLFVDGALNRLAPMVTTDGLILATGAARLADPEELAGEMRAVGSIFGLPAYPRRETGRAFGSLLVAATVDALAGAVAEGEKTLWLRGAVKGELLAPLAARLAGRLDDVTLLVEDPIKILVTGDPVQAWNGIQAFHRAGGSVASRRPLPLIAVTVNPFYPEFDRGKNAYKPAFIDASRLRDLIGGSVTVPVVDVMRDGAEGLLALLVGEAGAGGP